MAQFWIHKNANPDTKRSVPYLLDVQHRLLDSLAVRLAVPVMPEAPFFERTLQTLMIPCTVAGKNMFIVTPLIAGIAQQNFGAPVLDVSHLRTEIIGAIDLLISGV